MSSPDDIERAVLTLDFTPVSTALSNGSSFTTAGAEGFDPRKDFCEEAFEQMNLAKLFQLVKCEWLLPGDMTFAAEIAGRRIPGDVIVPILLNLLSSKSPLVREGAVYGLSHHLSDEVRQSLLGMSQHEASWGVARAIEEVLDQ